MIRLFTTACALALCCPSFSFAVTFTNDVMAVLARGGCNQGACHGNLNGKGGLKLSLRGEDPIGDYQILTREMLGRRLDPLRPDESLLLRKSAGLVPHEGGVRFSRDSEEYRILRDWIAAGTPRDPGGAGTPRDPGGVPHPVRLEVTPTESILFAPAERFRIRVRGTFSDGSVRDLTGLSVYELTEPGVVRISGDGEVVREQFGEVVVLVRYLAQQVPVKVAFLPDRPTAWKPPPSTHPIDQLVFDQLRTLRLPPSELVGDGMFVRRAYLDALGILPTVAETRAFLADGRPDKRERLIDTLLQRPEFADFWAQKWSDLLRNEEKALDRKGVRAFHQWIRAGIDAGKPLNEFARELIAGRGSTYEQPAANLYRSLRDPLTRAESVAQVFLGVRIGCAKCHNHPFDRWTMDEYHQFAALFSQVQYRIRENNRKDRLDTHEFDGEQIVYVDRATEWLHPRTKTPAAPKLLGVDAKPLTSSDDRLLVLADWVADPTNPFFARAQANRVWRHLMGRGLVEPNDDFRLSNPPTNPALLDYLTRDLVEHRFDLRHLVRRVMTSQTYQLSSMPNAINADDELHHSRAMVKPLPAESLLDALSQVLQVPVAFEGYPKGVRAGQVAAPPQTRRRGATQDESFRFLKVFGQPDRLLTCECERSEDPGLLQAFQLITGKLVQDMIREPDNRLGRLIAAGRTDDEIVDELFLAALSRQPGTSERKAVLAQIARATDRRQGLEDVAWAVVNAKEFILRR